MRRKNRSGWLRDDFLEGGGYSGIPPFLHTRIFKGVCPTSTCANVFAEPKTLLTLPSLWTQRTRPQGTWKTAKSAVFHSANSNHLFLGRRKKNDRGTTRTSQPNCPRNRIRSIWHRRRQKPGTIRRRLSAGPATIPP